MPAAAGPRPRPSGQGGSPDSSPSTVVAMQVLPSASRSSLLVGQQVLEQPGRRAHWRSRRAVPPQPDFQPMPYIVPYRRHGPRPRARRAPEEQQPWAQFGPAGQTRPGRGGRIENDCPVDRRRTRRAAWSRSWRRSGRRRGSAAQGEGLGEQLEASRGRPDQARSGTAGGRRRGRGRRLCRWASRSAEPRSGPRFLASCGSQQR